MRRIVLIVLALWLLNSTVLAQSTTTPHDKRVTKHITQHIKHYQRKKKRQYATATFIVTAYTAIDAGMNGRAITASGRRAIAWHTVAASHQWPFGTRFKLSNGQIWMVMDRGGAITDSNRLDLYVGQDDIQTALKWGVKTLTVQVIRR